MSDFLTVLRVLDTKVPRSPHSPVPKTIRDSNNPTEASAIIASGAALGDLSYPEAAPCRVFRKVEI